MPCFDVPLKDMTFRCNPDWIVPERHNSSKSFVVCPHFERSNTFPSFYAIHSNSPSTIDKDVSKIWQKYIIVLLNIEQSELPLSKSVLNILILLDIYL